LWDDLAVEPGLSSRTRLHIASRQATYRKTTISQNPDTGTRRYLTITKKRKERKDRGVAARQPVPLPRIQSISFRSYNECSCTGDGLRCGQDHVDRSGEAFLYGRRFLLYLFYPRLEPFYELADHCIDLGLIRPGYIPCGQCEKSGSYSVPDRGIGACIAPRLVPDWKGQHPAKQSAAIFSGIPVLRGDFGEGGGEVRQQVLCPNVDISS